MSRCLTLACVLFTSAAAAQDPAAAPKDPAAARRAPIPGVDGTYFVVPPEAAARLGDDMSRYWGEIEGRPGEDDLVLLRRARLAAVKRAWALVEQEFEAGTATPEDLFRVARELKDARLEPATTDAERLAAWEEYLPHIRRLDAESVADLEIGGVQGFRPMDASLVRAQRMAAEVEVLKLRRKVYGDRVRPDARKPSRSRDASGAQTPARSEAPPRIGAPNAESPRRPSADPAPPPLDTPGQ